MMMMMCRGGGLRVLRVLRVLVLWLLVVMRVVGRRHL